VRGGAWGKEAKFQEIWIESPRGPKTQESNRPRLELTLPDAKRGTAFQLGSTRWSVDRRPIRFSRKTQERKELRETSIRSTGRRKAL
jgi:hypothetical protein